MPFRRTVLDAAVVGLALSTSVPALADHDNGNGNGKSQDGKSHGKAKGRDEPRPEREMGGGPFENRSNVYLERTVVNRTDDIVASGLKGVAIAHGIVDGLVTHDESRQLQALLRRKGMPVDMWSALTHSASSESGTTVDGYAPVPHDSPVAGHASETSSTHDVGLAGFAALARLYSGTVPTCRETLFDGKTGLDRSATTGC